MAERIRELAQVVAADRPGHAAAASTLPSGRIRVIKMAPLRNEEPRY